MLLGGGLGVRQEYRAFHGGYDRRALGRRYDEALGRVPIVLAAWWPNKRPLQRAARWDGVMPYWPALLGGQVGPEGQQPTDASVEEELQEMLGYYSDVTEASAEIVLPREQRDNSEYDALCAELGATWLLSAYAMDADEIRKGPPNS